MATKKAPTKKKTSTRTEKKPVEVTAESLMKVMKPAHVRFVLLYLGAEDGKCFNNATLSYLRAFDIQTTTLRIKQENGTMDFTKEYKSAKSSASDLLTSPNIQKLRHFVLLEQGYRPETIKKRFAELAMQNKNLPIAHASTRDMAKIAGVLQDDKTKVDIPQLTELTDAIKQILTP